VIDPAVDDHRQELEQWRGAFALAIGLNRCPTCTARDGLLDQPKDQPIDDLLSTSLASNDCPAKFGAGLVDRG
jgi:hypothetical protein